MTSAQDLSSLTTGYSMSLSSYSVYDWGFYSKEVFYRPVTFPNLEMSSLYVPNVFI